MQNMTKQETSALEKRAEMRQILPSTTSFDITYKVKRQPYQI